MRFSALIILLAFFAFSCSSDDIAELIKGSKTFILEQSEVVDIPDGNVTTFSATEEFDASADIARFSSNVDDIEITSITMEFSDYEGDDVTITDANIAFEGTSVSLSISDPINLAASIGGVYTLDVDASIVDILNDKFLADQKLTVIASGSVDKVPVVFTVKFTFDIKVTGTLK